MPAKRRSAFKKISEGAADTEAWGWLQTLNDIYPSYTWQLVFGPFFAAMGFFILYFLWKELADRNLRRNLILALGLYAAAVGLDFFEGIEKYSASGWDPYEGLALFMETSSKSDRHYSKLLEEATKMFATTVFLVLFLRCFLRIASSWEIPIAEKGRGADEKKTFLKNII